MQKKDWISAFTIIELLVTIALISIILLGAAQFNFSRLSQGEKLNIETIKTISLIEEVRNNALIGKWVWVDLDTPESWTIDISQTSSGSVHSYYTLENTNTGQYLSWNTVFPFSITDMQCLRHNGTFENINTDISLIFSWDSSQLVWCSDDTFKKLTFNYWTWNFSTNITFNSVTGVIETN